MAVKKHPYGAKLAYSTTENGSYTDITDCKALKPPALDRNETPTGHLESTNMTDESIPGKRIPGELTLSCYMHQTQLAELQSQYQLNGDAAVYWWRISMPLLTGQTTPLRLKGAGWLKTLDVEEMTWDGDDAIMMPITIKATGVWTWTAGS